MLENKATKCSPAFKTNNLKGLPSQRNADMEVVATKPSQTQNASSNAPAIPMAPNITTKCESTYAITSEVMKPPTIACIALSFILFMDSSVKPIRPFHTFPKSGPYQIHPTTKLTRAATNTATQFIEISIIFVYMYSNTYSNHDIYHDG